MFAAIVIVGGLLFAFMSFSKHGGKKHLDIDRYRTKWLAIEQQLIKGNVASYSMAVINADKLLDQALGEKGLRGQTLAESLKSGAKLFTNRNKVWAAHKLRNRISHDADAVVSYEEARYALSGFKQALKDVGAI